MPDAPDEWHQTIFPIVNHPSFVVCIPSDSDYWHSHPYSQVSADTGGDPILTAAQSLASKLREKNAFTNTATFDLMCEVSFGACLMGSERR
jgi:ubiquitin thioesterase OTU1